MKMQRTEWEMLFANDIYNKGVDIKNTKRTHTTHYQRTKTSIKNGQGMWTDIFQRRYTDSYQELERC